MISRQSTWNEKEKILWRIAQKLELAAKVAASSSTVTTTTTTP